MKQQNACMVEGTTQTYTSIYSSPGNRRSCFAIFICILFALSFFPLCNTAFAQTSTPNPKYKARQEAEKDSVVPFKKRWSIRTNAVDWLLVLPNAAVEFDVGKSPYNRYTVGLGFKWNWNTSQNYKPSIVYNILDVRPEFRYYYRTEPRNNQRSKDEKISFFKRMKEDVFTIKRLHPRYWRAYYIGAYINATKYSLKFGKQGKQGSAYGAGVTGGFSIPLYGYKEKYVDLEFGGSLGLMYAKYDTFKHDPESNCYPRIPEKSKGGHMVPFPVVSDLRVSFVFRFASVKNKYKLVDNDKLNARLERKRLKMERKDSLRQVKLREDAVKDSLKAIKLKEKEAEKIAKQQADSLKRLGIDIEKKEETVVLKDSVAIQPSDSTTIDTKQSGSKKASKKDKKKKKEANEIKPEKEKKPAKEKKEKKDKKKKDKKGEQNNLPDQQQAVEKKEDGEKK